MYEDHDALLDAPFKLNTFPNPNNFWGEEIGEISSAPINPDNSVPSVSDIAKETTSLNSIPALTEHISTALEASASQLNIASFFSDEYFKKSNRPVISAPSSPTEDGSTHISGISTSGLGNLNGVPTHITAPTGHAGTVLPPQAAVSTSSLGYVSTHASNSSVSGLSHFSVASTNSIPRSTEDVRTASQASFLAPTLQEVNGQIKARFVEGYANKIKFELLCNDKPIDATNCFTCFNQFIAAIDRCLNTTFSSQFASSNNDSLVRKGSCAYDIQDKTHYWLKLPRDFKINIYEFNNLFLSSVYYSEGCLRPRVEKDNLQEIVNNLNKLLEESASSQPAPATSSTKRGKNAGRSKECPQNDFIIHQKNRVFAPSNHPSQSTKQSITSVPEEPFIGSVPSPLSNLSSAFPRGLNNNISASAFNMTHFSVSTQSVFDPMAVVSTLSQANASLPIQLGKSEQVSTGLINRKTKKNHQGIDDQFDWAKEDKKAKRSMPNQSESSQPPMSEFYGAFFPSTTRPSISISSSQSASSQPHN